MSRANVRFLAFLLCVAGVIYALPTSAPPKVKAETATVAGRAVDSAGRPVDGAEIVLFDTKGKAAARATSNRDGSFRFDDVTPGTIQVLAARPDIGMGTRDLSVRQGKAAHAVVSIGAPTRVSNR